MADTLREKLIEAVSIHEGWEESAIALVDEAIMPVLLSKLKSEDFIKDAMFAVKHSDIQFINEPDYRLEKAARAVIEALEKELVG